MKGPKKIPKRVVLLEGLGWTQIAPGIYTGGGTVDQQIVKRFVRLTSKGKRAIQRLERKMKEIRA